MTTNSSPTETDVPAWVGIAAGAGILGFIVATVGFDRPPVWLAIPAMVLLGAASIGGMSHRWFIGFQPPTRLTMSAQPRGLVGSQISVGGSVFTVLDDSAVTGDGRRASVIARDSTGRVGILFVGFSPDGRVIEARCDDGAPWRSAELID